MRALAWVQYKGKGFSGYQKQPGKRTVAGELEKSLESIFQKKVKVFGCARTDAGAHAICHPVVFDVLKNLSEGRLLNALNAHLPEDIRILQIKEVSDDFVPLREAVARTYVYLILKNRKNAVFFQDFAYHPGFNITEEDEKELLDILSVYEGTHDYTAFSKSGSAVKSRVRTVFETDLKSTDDLIALVFTGSGFLYGQIRAMVASAVGVLRGKITREDIKEALEKKVRINAGNVPACGLYLYQVWFKNKYLNFKPTFPFLSILLPEEKSLYAKINLLYAKNRE